MQVILYYSRTVKTLVIFEYSDTLANEDNLFRNHIR